MNPTNATSFAPTFTYRAAAPAIGADKTLIRVRWHSRPSKRRFRALKSWSELCCDVVEATISASLSWIASFVILGLIHCAAMLAAHHTVLAGLHHLGSLANGL